MSGLSRHKALGPVLVLTFWVVFAGAPQLFAQAAEKDRAQTRRISAEERTRLIDRMKAMDSAITLATQPPAVAADLPPIVVSRPVAVPVRVATIRAKGSAAAGRGWFWIGLLAGAGLGVLSGILLLGRRMRQQRGRGVPDSRLSAIAELEAMVGSGEQCLHAQQESIHELERRLQISSNQLNAAQSRQKELADQSRILQAECVRLADEAAQDRARREKAVIAANKAQTHAKQVEEGLNAQLSQAQQSLADTRERLAEQQEVVSRLLLRNGDLEAQLREQTESRERLSGLVEQMSRQGEAESGKVAPGLDDLCKQRDEANWYLGEARGIIERLEGALRDGLADRQSLESELQAMNNRVTALSAELDQTRREKDEANWYLNEARSGEAQQALQRQVESGQSELAGLRAHLDQLDNEIRARDERLNQLTSELDAICKQRDEANWFLGEARVAREQAERSLAENAAQRQRLQDQLTRLESAAGRVGKPWWSGLERRAPARIAFPEEGEGRVRLQVVPSDGKAVSASVRNLSVGGLCARLSPRWLLNDVLKIRLLLPKQEKPIDVTAAVAWKDAPSSKTGAHVGLAFREISDENQNLLNKFLESLQTAESQA